MQNNEDNPGDIHLIDEMGANIYGPLQMIIIPRIEPSVQHQALGLPIKPENTDHTSQLNQLKDKVKNRVSKSSLASERNECRWIAHRSYLILLYKQTMIIVTSF